MNSLRTFAQKISRYYIRTYFDYMDTRRTSHHQKSCPKASRNHSTHNRHRSRSTSLVTGCVSIDYLLIII